jgi:hypothetical protein
MKQRDAILVDNVRSSSTLDDLEYMNLYLYQPFYIILKKSVAEEKTGSVAV